MEIILLQDVKALGKKGEIVKVNDGYARNFLLPKKVGIEANNKNLTDLAAQKFRAAKEEEEREEDARQQAASFEGKVVTIPVKCGEGGRVFGSVSTKEIAQDATKQLGLDIDKKKMQLDEPIRMVGTVIVPIKLHKNVTGQLTVKVTEG